MEIKPWKDLIYSRFKNRGHPILVSAETVVPAASLLSGAYEVVSQLRELGANRNDRVLISFEKGPGFIYSVLACLWEDLCIVVANHNDDTDEAIAETKPHFLLRSGMQNTVEVELIDRWASPSDFRMLLKTSGTTDRGRWVALADDSLRLNVFGHLPLLGLSRETILLSVLPWHHAFGLVLDLLTGLFSGAAIILDIAGGRDIELSRALISEFNVNHLSATPLFFDRLLSGWPELSSQLKGGIIGGAPICGELARGLEGTMIRAGYGQTEAGPGITLGEPGEFMANILGYPLNCDTYIANDGELMFRGPNAFLGYWNGVELEEPETEWIPTGDLVSQSESALVFRGRKQNNFKLENGRWLQTFVIEKDLEKKLSAEVAILPTGDGRFSLFCSKKMKVKLYSKCILNALGSLASYCSEIILYEGDSLPLELKDQKGNVDKKILRNIMEKYDGIYQN